MTLATRLASLRGRALGPVLRFLVVGLTVAAYSAAVLGPARPAAAAGPQITSITPAEGSPAGGTQVTISGSGFTGATSVTIGQVATGFSPVSDTALTVTTPPNYPGTVALVVTTPGGTATGTFTYEAIPVVSSVSPDANAPGGGGTVTISGVDFENASAVMFGTVPASSFTVTRADGNAAGVITATVPPGTAGTSVNVTVTTPDGTSAVDPAGTFYYVSAPTVTGISTSAGPTTGGATITVTGSNFYAGTAVYFGTAAASGLQWTSTTSLQATVPAAVAAGTVDVTVATAAGTSAVSPTDQYTYETAPAVAAFSPDSIAPDAGPTSLVLSGSNLGDVSSVRLTGQDYPFYGPEVDVTATSITVPDVTCGPAGFTGASDLLTVTLVVPGGTVSGGTILCGSVSQLTPDAGPPAGGTQVLIGASTSVTTTTPLVEAKAVYFGGQPASFAVQPSGTLLATAPAGTGDVPITIQLPGGTIGPGGPCPSVYVPSSCFSYEGAPQLGGLSVDTGRSAGDTSVTITGQNLAGATSVDFGTTPAWIVQDNPTSLQVKSPAGSGTVNVTVTTPLGTTATSAASVFTYLPLPAVTGLSPTTGNAGSTVNITGTGFAGASGVSFGGAPAPSFTVNSSTSITATAPTGTGTVDVTVTTPTLGTSATAPADEFSYILPYPAVTRVGPNVVPAGTAVTVTGVNFTGATAVNFGSTPATSFTVNGPTSITATVPRGSGTVDVTVTTAQGASATSPADEFTYPLAPAVTGVVTNSGYPGSVVALYGSGFVGTTSVTFGSTPATFYGVSSASLWAVAPTGTGTVNITVTTPAGSSSAVAGSQFTYVPPPSVTAVTGTTGSGGSTLTVTGTNLTGTTAVSFGSTPATSFTVNGPTSITVTVPGGTGTVDVTVTTPAGTSATSPADQFTYLPNPVVTGMSPAGSFVGTIVTISGFALAGATAVAFGSTPATSFTVNGPTSITATVPGGTGTVDVTVTTPSGTSATSPADEFTYLPYPVMTGVSPNAGVPGNIVTVSGSGFIGVTQVDFGAVPAASFTVNNASSITAVVPPGTGAVNVVVATSLATTAPTPSGQFTYLPPPTVTGVAPGAGIAGSTVTISGTNFVGVVDVTFGTIPAASFAENGPTSITAIAPTGTGTVDVTVTTALGTSGDVVADEFTYLPPPMVTGMSPVGGPPGTTVTLTGSGFTGATAVNFGYVPATSFAVNSPTSITAVVPQGSGSVFVTVTTGVATSALTSAAQFTYLGPPTVTALSPNAGLAGATVTISGTSFTGVTGVSFGTQPAATFTVNGLSSITATAPSGSGTVNVSVTTALGTSTVVTADQFTYLSRPIVTGVSPASGSPGTAVLVTGTALATVTGVRFGATPATTFESFSPTALMAITPAGVGTVDVTVTTTVATSAASAADQFTYVNPPIVTGVNPTVGVAGTVVSISGTGFTGATRVMFGATPATSFAVNGATSITATAPAGAGTADITVTTAVATSEAVPADEFTYLAQPSVTGLSPTSGVVGSAILVSGTNFTNVTGVSFGAEPAPTFSILGSTLLSVTAPAGIGTVDITVTNSQGTSAISPADEFTYLPPPTVTAVGPETASAGTVVTISGTALTGASAVDFGSTPCPSFTVAGPTQVTATVPNGAGTVDVTVTTPDGSSATSSSDQFTFGKAAPVVQSVVNSYGDDGAVVRVTVSAPNPVTSVAIGGAAAPFTTASGYPPGTSALSVTVPSLSPGIYGLSVTTAAGSSVAVPFTVDGAPTLTSVSPWSGPYAGGAEVTLTGSSFPSMANGVQVSFNGWGAAVVASTFSSLTVITPPGGPSLANITVQTPYGSTTLQNAYEYAPAPTATGMGPYGGSASGGTSVFISGTDFFDVTAVDFGDVPAASISEGSDQVEATAPALPPGAYPVTVTSPSGTTSAMTFWAEAGPPVVTSVTPQAAQGGQVLTLSGANLAGWNYFTLYSGTFNELFYDTTDDSTSSGSIQIPLPGTLDLPSGPSNLTVYTALGQASITVDLLPYPAITAVTPEVANGGQITVDGVGLTDVSLTIGGKSAPILSDSPTAVEATVPAGVTGTVAVRASTGTVLSPLTSADEVDVVPGPVITSLSPSKGTWAGGQAVTITGENFSPSSTVTFCGAPAAVVSLTSTSIVATSPEGSVGVCTVAVVGSTPLEGATFPTGPSRFTYVGPTITSLSPTTGPGIGGTSVTITGSNLAGISSVVFGTVASPQVRVNSATSVTAIAPPGTGTVRIIVDYEESSYTSTKTFKYLPPPAITSLSPASGPVAGGTRVTIHGTDLAGATAVDFGGVAATVVSNSSSAVVVTTPAGVTTGPVAVTVTDPDGTSAVTGHTTFTYT